MISLFEIAQKINEADVDDDKIIKYKDKEGESQEMTAGAAKKQPEDHPAKVAYNKMANKSDDSEKDAGGKLGGSDFERDGGDDPIGDKGDVGVGELPDRSSELPKKTAKQQSDFEKKRDAMFKKARGGAEDDVRAAILERRGNGYLLQHASPALKADKEVVLAAVRENGYVLQYASPALKADREVVLAAVSNDSSALVYADEALKADKEVVLAAVSNDSYVLSSTRYGCGQFNVHDIFPLLSH